MKHSELESKYIDQAREILNRLLEDFTRPYLSPSGKTRMRGGALKGSKFIPDLDDFRFNFQTNIANVDNPIWYLDYLKLGFNFIKKRKIILMLFEAKDEISRELKSLTKDRYNPHLGEEAISRVFEEDKKSLLYALANVDRFLSLIQTIDECLLEAERTLQQPPAATVEKPETVENIQINQLPWNASRSSLYHLFAQLLDTRRKNGNLLQDSTPDSVAAFLLQSFPGLPSVITITREIQKYRALNGKPPEKSAPKDAIRINDVDFGAD